MVPPCCIFSGYLIAFCPSCSCSFTSLIEALLCLQAVSPTFYGYAHSHSGLSPFMLMFVHFPHRRSALPASSLADLLWVSVMRQNQSCYKYRSSQMLQNNLSVSRRGGSALHCHPLSAGAPLILIYHCSYIPWQTHVHRYRG